MHRRDPARLFEIQRRAAQYRAMRRTRCASILLAAGLLSLVAGCHLAPPGGMADRCADIMQRAFPDADIDITKREAAAISLTTIVARVEGIRNALPPQGPVARNLAVECRFDNSILTGFRWTSGPLQAAQGPK
jgi:hypothetical protein